MKKFRLKPLGELRQKFSMNWFFIGLVMALCVSACSNDDDEKIAPTFPEKQTIESSANDTKELIFEASADWQLTTSATWCRFVVDGKEEYSLSGTAGKQTVTIKVTDEAQQPDAKSIAQITLMMGANKAVIADVARNAKDLFLTVYDADGNEIGEDGVIKVGYKDYNSFKVKANFRFAATNRPEWLDLQGGSLVGSVNEEVVSGVRIVEEAKFFKYTQDGKITFADDKGLYSKSYKLAFEGMDRDEIIVSRPTQLAWDWTVSLDGKTFSQAGGSSPTGGTNAGTTYMYGVPYTVSAFGDEFETVYIEDYNSTYYDDAYTWILLDGKDGDMRLTVQPADAERTGYVFVFTKSKYETIKENLVDSIFPKGEINYRYEQSNLLMQFTQKESKPEEDDNNAMTAIVGAGGFNGYQLECVKYTGGDAEQLKSKHKVSAIYDIPQPSITSMIVDTRISINDYKAFYLSNDESIIIVTSFIEQNNETNLMVNASYTKNDFYLIIKDEKGNGKMLIVRASNQSDDFGSGDIPFNMSYSNDGGATKPAAECTLYTGADRNYWLDDYSLDEVYETSAQKSMFISYTPFNITSFQCLGFDSLADKTEEVCADLGTELNLWVDGQTESLVVIISDGTKKYGIIIKVS